MSLRMSLPKLGLLVVVFIFLVIGGLIFIRSEDNVDIIEEKPQTKTSQLPTNTTPEVFVPGLPVQLIIPKINVEAAIESMGLTPEGDLDAPKEMDNAGWYSAGARPGSIGSAVMDGHFGAADDKPAVFDELHTLQIGDPLYVKDGNGTTHTFIVKETRLFQPEEDASVVFRSNDDKAHLNLITCQGAWNKNKISYSARLVVFTDLLTE